MIGILLASLAVIGNDAVQTLGTFIVSNGKTKWWKQWLAASLILLVTILYSWFAYDGDISFGRLARLPYQTVHWYHALAPLVLLAVTRLGIPVSTTFLVLSVFASTTVFDKMLIKSVVGYSVAAVAAYTIWYVLSYYLNEKTEQVKPEHEKAWRAAQWSTTGFLWFTWLSHDMANIAVFAPRQLSLPYLIGILTILIAALGFIFWERGGKIQQIVVEKTSTKYVRSATIIDAVYAVLLLVFKEWNDIPMSTTWVFVGLLCGRELAIAKRFDSEVKKVWPIVARDFIKVMMGLGISVILVLLINYFK